MSTESEPGIPSGILIIPTSSPSRLLIGNMCQGRRQLWIIGNPG
jgi:hypothetical protein